jgi:hypothetical protein
MRSQIVSRFIGFSGSILLTLFLTVFEKFRRWVFRYYTACEPVTGRFAPKGRSV